LSKHLLKKWAILIQFNSTIQFIQWSQMHAQQLFLNVCNTAILGYHGDKIILYKNVKNIKYVKNHRLFNYQIGQDHKLFDYKICQHHR